MKRVYACIDLKSFYASCECVERNLDPLTTNLVVADSSRTEKTICLAVTPSLKKYGLSGRSRLFEVVSKVKKINYERRKNNSYKSFISKSYNDIELERNKNLELDYIIAPPRMKLYMEYSTKIYGIYLKYLSKDDIYVYSIDEVFCDITSYLKLYNLSYEELITKIIKDIYDTTGITATAGIGDNLYLAKIAMDIEAKHENANEFGVRIAYLNEFLYRKKLWNHTPITDFWRVGKGYAKRLEQYQIYTMGDIARVSIDNEDLLYKIFGVNAELLIDHAWGYEPCTIIDIKNYKPESSSISSGQVLHCPYNYSKAKLIVLEMTELLTLELVEKKLVTDQLVLNIGYDISNLTNTNNVNNFEIVVDQYSRKIPKPTHGTINLDFKTSSTKIILEKVEQLYDRIVNKNLLIKRINICASRVYEEIEKIEIKEQLNLFDYNKPNMQSINHNSLIEENKLQNILLDIKKKYGKNSILKGMNLCNGARTIERNNEVGGHRA